MPKLPTTPTLTTTAVTSVLVASEALNTVIIAFVLLVMFMAIVWVVFTDRNPVVLTRWWGLLFRSPPGDDDADGDHDP